MIAEFLYKNPRILLLTIAVIVVAGSTSLIVMPRAEDPTLRRRVAVISTIYPGADAQQVESLVTVGLERKLTSVSEIKQVRSSSRTGISNIVIELQDEVNDVDPVWSRVRDRMVDAGAELPVGCQQPELEVFPLKAYAAIVAVQWKDQAKPNFAILRRLAANLRSKFLEIPGTEKVDTFGDPGEEFVAEVTPLTLASLGLTTAALAQQVSGSYSNRPMGRLPSAEADLLLDLKTSAMPVERLANTIVSVGPRGGEPVALSEIAKIKKQLAQPADQLALIEGRPAIVLGALVSDSMRIDKWSDEMNLVIANFGLDSGDYTIEVLFSQRKHVDERMMGLGQSLALGAAAVVFIVLLLMGWRSMLVVVTALPLSAMVVIVGMRTLSIPIHQMSVTGLIVALGLLIDNAIVMVEEVRSKILAGESTQQAIQRSVRHLAMPLFGSTLTTTLAFLPIATLPGPSGEFVGAIAISVILAICASFALSMTLIPALCGLVRIRPSQTGLLSYGLASSTIQRLYEYTLRLVFRFPVIGVILGLALPSIGFFTAQSLPKQFFPPSDRRQIQIEVERPARDTVEGTQFAVDNIRQIVAANENVNRQHWFVGSSAPTFFYNVVPRRRGTAFYAQAFVDLHAGPAVETVVRDLQKAIDDQIFDSRAIVRQLEQGPPFDAPIEIRVVGPDLTILQSLGSELRLILSQTGNVIHTRSDLEETITKLSLQMDGIALKKVGLNESQIAAQLYTTLEGAPAGRMYDGAEELPVFVKMALGSNSKLELLGATRLPRIDRAPAMPRGPDPRATQTVDPQHPTLASLANFELDSDVGGVVRINGQRVNEVKAYIRAGVLPAVVMDEFKQRLSAADFVLPSGYALEFGGETEQRSNAVNALIANAIVLFALMTLTLVAAFRSFRCALIIAVVGGLSAGLGPLALSVFGFPLGFMAIVGTMGLVGVAINDSIVVLAAIRANPASSQSPQEMTKVVSGCTRHIIATTLTTIVGFLPLILGGGGFWPPMALTIAGGVGGATLLALYFVPSFYLLVNTNGPANHR